MSIDGSHYPLLTAERTHVQSVCVLQVSPRDVFGGAERVAWNLTAGARTRGMKSWLAVGHRGSDDIQVVAIPDSDEFRGPWGQLWMRAHRRLRGSRFRGSYRLAGMTRWLAEPKRSFEQWRGVEDFQFPGSCRLLELTPVRPDLVHCHNLHGGYFDLRFLSQLSAEVPVVLTLHDSWLLTGHCSHSMSCDRWKTGCGACPDLTLYPAIRRDATAYNWQRKRDIYRRSRLYVASPCKWLMRRVEESMLAAGTIETRVIPNGVDLDVFRPGNQREVRKQLGLPPSANVLLFAANQWIRESRAKDYATLRKALELFGNRSREGPVILVALGETAPNERVGHAEVRFVPYQNDPAVVASYYQAADVYVHAAHVDTFPTTILEALACGTPVVATAVCGIPEQVKGWTNGVTDDLANRHSLDEATGILVPPADAETMASAIARLLENDPARTRLATNARLDAQARFDLRAQIDEYIGWYATILDRWRQEKRSANRHS